MTKTNFPAMMTKTPAPLRRVEEDRDKPMTDRTASELQELCKQQGVEFDTALTDRQARQRIETLKSGTAA